MILLAFNWVEMVDNTVFPLPIFLSTLKSDNTQNYTEYGPQIGLKVILLVFKLAF